MAYDVYGIGNALLDIQLDVSFEFLQQNNIPKGIMSYVSQERQSELIERIGQDRIRQVSSGGSVANSMIVLQHFGGKGFFSCKIAQDEAGDQYLNDIAAAGLTTNYNENARPKGDTGRCLVKISPDADRTMSTNLGISETLSDQELNIEALKQSTYLYLEGYLTTSPSGLHAALKAKQLAEQHGVKTAITFSDPAIVAQFKTEFHQLIDNGVDLIFCNEAEAKEFTETKDLKHAISQLKQLAPTFVITIGPRGSLVYDGTQLLTVPATEEKPIDTVGAGDMYAGAFLYGITNGLSWLQAGQLANLTSSKVVTIYGPRVSKEHTEALLQQLRSLPTECS